MQDITRRGFVSAAAIAAVTMPGLALAEEQKSAAATSSASALTGTADASAYIDNPGTDQTMTLDEINAVRKQIVDSITEDWVQEDGTVVPVVYRKVRELINTFSVGFGTGCKDGNWDQVMHNMSEEEAQAFLEMPWGKMFSAQDFAHESGRDEAACEEICYTMSLRGLLYRVTRGDRHYYHVCGYFHGIWEFGQLYHVFHRTDPSLTTFEEKAKDPAVVDLCNMHVAQWGDMSASVTATAFFYTHPAGAEVIKEGEELITYDDWRAQVERNTIIAVSPCQCRIRRHAQDAWIYGTEPCNHPIETCMSFGEFAEYYIENGIGRQITQEEAIEIIENAIYNHGMVMQSTYTKAMELFCFCHGDCCDIMSGYVALGEGITQGTAAVKHANISHYLLDHNVDECIGCGICVDRCPVFAISLDEEAGVSVTSATCVRCGQCGIVCPTGCRKLTARPDVPYLPEDLVADYNLKASDRMSHGILG